MPYLFYATSTAGSVLQKADYGINNPANPALSSFSSIISIHEHNADTLETYINTLVSSKYYTSDYFFNRNSSPNFILVNSMAAPPTIICPGNIVSNTDPGLCKASISGLAATISDPDGDITKLTWTMTGATIAASPVSGINNILTPFDFNKGITTVTYKVTDATLSSTSCSFTVTVTDKEVPSIVCPLNAPITIPSCAILTDTIIFSLLAISDNCGILNFSSNAPVQFPVGNTSVIWTAHDISGNLSQCSQTVTVTNAPALDLIGSNTPVSCFGGNDGTATVGVSGGTPPYTYSWNTTPVQTSVTVSNLIAGIYTVTVTDFDGCSSSIPVTVDQPAAILTIAVGSQVNVDCFGSSTGSVTVAGSGGTPIYQYSINGVSFQAGGTFSNLAAGAYTLTVRDSRNCVDTTSITITQPGTAIGGAVISQTNVACLGSATGSVTVSGNGGTPPYQYNINGGAFQPGGTFNNLSAGAYTIIVKDANNCTSPLVVTITQAVSLITASITSQTNVLCAGQANGSATVAANGGTSPYTYSWNTIPVQTSATAINLTARNYIVTITDAAGCVKPFNVTITQPTPLTIAITKTDVACFEDSTGIATALASGGTPPYTYAWLTVPIQTTATVSNLPAGTYTVAVFDSLGCFKPAFVTITEPDTQFTASITNQVNVLCAGSNTGSLTASGIGGVPPCEYNLNGGVFQASGTFNGLSAGNYTIIARDANKCSVNLPATITAPATPLTAAITSQTNVLCAGQANGDATVSASGGTSPYTYSWNTIPVQTTATAINLTARNYTVTVTDAFGCLKPVNVTITQPTPLTVSITRADISCFGDSTGTATATAIGGTPPYTYAWLTVPIQTTATVSNLPAGTYTVAVFDSLGCFKPAFVTITEPVTPLTASITNQVNVLCASSNTGSLTVAGSGGTPPYQYNLNGGAFQSSDTFSSLIAGTYTIITRDANNCEFTFPATITAPANSLSAIIIDQTNVLCSGQANGSATVIASGGTLPYSYSWNTIPVQTTATVSNLSARTYTVITTDASGCTIPLTLTITQPAPLNVSITKTDVVCSGDSTGIATALASGGTPPYTYAWLTTPIQTTATISNLPAGTYTVAVFDSLGCFKPAFVTITEPAIKLTASITNQVNVLCASSNTGSLTVDGSGGIPPYQYNLNGGAFQASGTFNNLTAGVYNINVRDTNNCIVNVPVTITAPANGISAAITSQTNILCKGEANGSATVTANGGTAPYTYSWNTIPVQTTLMASNLVAGIYVVTTTDNNGCFVSDTAIITEPASKLTASITSQVNFDCFLGTNGSVTVSGAGGTPPYQYSLDGGTYQASDTFINLAAGSYIVTVRDANNCVVPLPVEITISGLILAVNDTVTTPEDTQVIGNVMTNDQVLCNLPIVVTANTAPLHGSAIVNSDGTFTYTPSLNYNGTDSFTYTIIDNIGGLSTATVSVQIDPVNDSPITFNDSLTVIYNLPKTDNVLLHGDYDPDSTALTVNTTPLIDPVNGTIVLAADGSFTYTPDLNYIGNDMVVVSICDAGTPLPPACANDTIFITVLPPNQPPVTVRENLNLCNDAPFVGTVSNGGTVFNGDTDPENNLPLTLSSIPVQGPLHGVFSITDTITGTFNYTPNSAYSGSDYVIVNICDSGIPVECGNDTIYFEILAPVIANAGLSQKLCNSDVAFLVGNSPAPGTGSWTLVSGPNAPTVFPSTGNVASATGLVASPIPYVFSYSIKNGSCLSTDTMSVINFISATPAYAGIDQNFCSDTANLTATFAASTPVNGTGTWTQLSGPNTANIQDITNPNTVVSNLTFGVYTFQWLITNGVCQANADVVNITISKTAVANAGIDLSTCKSTPVQVSGSSVQNSSSILWTTSGSGSFSDPAIINPIYTPGTLDSVAGMVMLTLNAVGNSPCPDVSDFAVLTINKTPQADAGPDESTCVGNSRTITQASASDYSTLLWSVAPITAGTITNPETLNPTFIPAIGFSGTAVLKLTVHGIGTCSDITVIDSMDIVVNTTLTANAGTDQTILPGTTATLSGSASGGSGFYAWSWQPSALLVNSSGENPVTVALNSETTFILTVLDITTGCTDNDTVQILMDNSGNPLVAVADYDTTLINMPVTVNVLANDLNPDEAPLTVDICGYPAHGIVVVNSDKTITYTPYSDYEGEDEFCYKICDENKPALCADTIVYIHVKQPSLNDLYVYNGISPNGDGNNDVWKIRGIEKYTDNTVLIFNRWGDKLREFANYNNTSHSWDGKNENGKPLPNGTYFYILDVKNVGVLKGWIYIRGDK